MTLTANLPARLESLLGRERVLSTASDLQKYAIENCAPALVVKPRNAEEVVEVVRFAAVEKVAVVCCGSRSKLQIGTPPRRYGLALDLASLAEIVHYDPADLTLSVDAGLSLAALSKILAAKSQFLPLSVPFLSSSTIGGTIACGVDSLLRLQYGTARDFLIGAEFVDGTGQLCKSGGRVVKNVTGYDIHKLLIGSLGTLGAITRLNFRTFPLPESNAGFLSSFSKPEAALSFRRDLLNSSLFFSSVELFDPRFAALLSGVLKEVGGPTSELLNQSSWFVYAAFSGNEAVVRRMQQELQDRASRDGAAVSEILNQQSNELLSNALREAFHWLGRSAPNVILVRQVQQQFTSADLLRVLGSPSQQSALLLSGCSICLLGILLEGNAEGSRDGLERRVRELCSCASGSASRATLLQAPAWLKARCGVWGQVPPDFPLMQRVKLAFDPQNIFSPGRFVGGL